jgi:NAD(P)-dependent dehydrogenase (short-subunit alcohol dehydrogenase family)
LVVTLRHRGNNGGSHGKVWFVTGAERGLGLEIARAALQAGQIVFAAARSVDAIRGVLGLDGDRLHAAPLDVSDQHAAVRAAAQAVERFGHIDVLVNNAAQAQLGWFETVDDADVRRNFEVNVFGAMHVARAVLPHLIEGWAEGLAQEVAPLGIRSLVVEPGMMRTDFLSDRSMRQGSLDVPGYPDAVAQFRAFIASANHQQPGDPAQLAARIVALAATPAPPERLVFGDDALAWAAAKVDRLRSEIAWSSA